MKLPSKIYLTSYYKHISTAVQSAPRSASLLGSIDNGTTWDLLHQNLNHNIATETINTPNITKSYDVFRFVIHKVGRDIDANRFNARMNTLAFNGYIDPQVIGNTSFREGQLNLNSEVITYDKTLFKRPFTVQLTSPNPNLNLSSMSNWSAQLTVSETE